MNCFEYQGEAPGQELILIFIGSILTKRTYFFAKVVYCWLLIETLEIE